MSVNPRSYFLERDLRYIFSYTVEFRRARQVIGPVPGGVRVNFVADSGTVFQVLNEKAPWAEGNIRGDVVEGATDEATLREDDVAISNVKLAFKTIDGAYVESQYRSLFPLGPGGYRELLREQDGRGKAVKLIGTNQQPFHARIFASSTYETSHPRYQWLTKIQCIGYGQVTIVDSLPQQVTMDIYGLA